MTTIAFSWPQQLAAQLGGVRLHKELCQAACRLGCARGVLQFFASLLTGTGLAAFITVVSAGGKPMDWSWTNWIVCVTANLVIDSAFNTVLNLANGLWYVVLMFIRLGLTVGLSIFTSTMLMLQFNQDAVQPRAEQIATLQFEQSLDVHRRALTSAETELKAAQKELADFSEKLGSTQAVAELPASCNTTNLPALSDDPSTSRMQVNARRQQQAHCARVEAQAHTTAKQQLSARDKVLSLLSTTIKEAEKRVITTQGNLSSAEKLRDSRISMLTRSLPVQSSALGAVMEDSPWIKLIFVIMQGLALAIECLALTAKAATARIDQAALYDRDKLLENCENHHTNITASLLLHRFSENATQTPSVHKSAQDFRRQGVEDAITTQATVANAKRSRQRLQAQMGIE